MKLSSFLIFPAGSVPGEVRSFILTIIDDPVLESDESLVLLAASNHSSHTLDTDTLSITIIDNDGTQLLRLL